MRYKHSKYFPLQLTVICCTLVLLFVGCNPPTGADEHNSSVLVLMVDYDTDEVVNGTEIFFHDSLQQFGLQAKLDPEENGIDVFNLVVKHTKTHQQFFVGNIIDVGTSGYVLYPKAFRSGSTFPRIAAPILPVPKPTMENLTVEIPESANFQKVWNSVKYLKIVDEYRKANPSGKMYVALYSAFHADFVGTRKPPVWNENKWVVFFNK